MKPEITITPSYDLSSELVKELEEWFQEEFSNRSYKWTLPNWYVTAWVENVLIGRAGIIKRTIVVNQQSVQVGGISGVVIRPKWRRRGIAPAIIKEGVTFIREELAAQFCLLLSRKEVAPLYTRLGWIPVEGPTTFEQPSGTTTYPHLTMIFPCGEKKWPPGPINLCGLPW